MSCSDHELNDTDLSENDTDLSENDTDLSENDTDLSEWLIFGGFLKDMNGKSYYNSQVSTLQISYCSCCSQNAFPGANPEQIDIEYRLLAAPRHMN